MKTIRATRLSSFISGICALVMIGSAALAADAYPSRPIRIVTPTAAGGGSDIQARLIGQKLFESWHQQIVVDNRPGAGSTIGTEIVARAEPDGHTLLLAAAGHAINVSLYKKLPYDTLKDFAAVIMLVSSPSVLVVSQATPVNNVKELIAYVKTRPGQLNYGSSGSGNSGHLAMELFKLLAGVDVTHVPYKGTAQAQTALLAGKELQMMFASPSSAISHVKAGRLRALGVTTLKRSSTMPDVPTIAESLPGYDADFWYAVVAPAKTPRAVIEKLNTELNRILTLPDVKERLLGMAVEPLGGSARDADTYIRAEVAKWSKVVNTAKVTVD